MKIFVNLGFSHGHVSSLSIARDALYDPPHPLSRPDPLHKIGREESDSVTTLSLENTRAHYDN